VRWKLNDARKEKQDISQAAKLLDQGQKAYEFVVRANGVHNTDLALAILNQVQRDAQKAEEMLLSTGAKSEK
jgi:hypothetical protein